MAIPTLFRGLFFQTVIITAATLPAGFYLMGHSTGLPEVVTTILLWPIILANHYDLLPVNPLKYPLLDFIYMTAFVQFAGVYVVHFTIHMTVKKRWSLNPRFEKSGPRWRRPPNKPPH